MVVGFLGQKPGGEKRPHPGPPAEKVSFGPTKIYLKYRTSGDNLGGGFKHFLSSSLFGEDSHFGLIFFQMG